MFNIGIVNDAHKTLNQLEQQLGVEAYHCSTIETKDEFSQLQLDGVVLCLETKEQVGRTVDWLLTFQKQPTLFSWVFSTIPLEYEEEVFLELGVNGVITTQKKESILPRQITNIFTRIHAEEESVIRERPGHLLNEKNQSILLDHEELPLTRKEFQLLWLLNERRNTAISYEEILETICPNVSPKDIYRIANIVFHIREKLKRNDEIEIKTVRSKGYMLVVK